MSKKYTKLVEEEKEKLDLSSLKDKIIAAKCLKVSPKNNVTLIIDVKGSLVKLKCKQV